MISTEEPVYLCLMNQDYRMESLLQDILIENETLITVDGFDITEIEDIIPFEPIQNNCCICKDSVIGTKKYFHNNGVECIPTWFTYQWISTYPKILETFERVTNGISISVTPIYIGQLREFSTVKSNAWKFLIEIKSSDSDICLLKSVFKFNCGSRTTIFEYAGLPSGINGDQQSNQLELDPFNHRIRKITIFKMDCDKAICNGEITFADDTGYHHALLPMLILSSSKNRFE